MGSSQLLPLRGFAVRLVVPVTVEVDVVEDRCGWGVRVLVRGMDSSGDSDAAVGCECVLRIMLKSRNGLGRSARVLDGLVCLRALALTGFWFLWELGYAWVCLFVFRALVRSRARYTPRAGCAPAAWLWYTAYIWANDGRVADLVLRPRVVAVRNRATRVAPDCQEGLTLARRLPASARVGYAYGELGTMCGVRV